MREWKFEDAWTRKGYPPVQFVTYARNDPDNAPVLDISPTLREARFWMDDRCGFVYRIERLPEATWADPAKPEYGNKTFVEEIQP